MGQLIRLGGPYVSVSFPSAFQAQYPPGNRDRFSNRLILGTILDGHEKTTHPHHDTSLDSALGLYDGDNYWLDSAHAFGPGFLTAGDCFRNRLLQLW